MGLLTFEVLQIPPTVAVSDTRCMNKVCSLTANILQAGIQQLVRYEERFDMQDCVGINNVVCCATYLQGRTAELIKNIRRLIGHNCVSLLAFCKSSFPNCRMDFGADDSDVVLLRSRALRSGILQLHLSPACSSRSRSPRHIVDFRIQRKRVVSPLHVGEEFVACILTGRPSMQATLWRPFPLVFAGSRQRRDPGACG